ncbi:MAG: sensor histidine kinase, partial [Acidimicrobiia bacterium]|nr:sensor histidine kinase [Acidimicrobiia bacterium]
RTVAARFAVAEERTRIARELHDVVAHAVSVMVLQTGAVRHRLPDSLDADREALRGVERTRRDALAEMRRVLGALRHGDEGAELAPHLGLDGLDALVAQVEQAGVPVHLEVVGDPALLPRGLELSAYRIVQEALTNTLKHAAASRADVVVRYGGEDLRIEVRDDGSGATAASRNGSGHGLVGVRERVAIYGGEMSAGPAPEGGYVLSVRLPLGGEWP